jgi:hypothetical protein
MSAAATEWKPSQVYCLNFATPPAPAFGAAGSPRAAARCRQIPRAASQGALSRTAGPKVALEARRMGGQLKGPAGAARPTGQPTIRAAWKIMPAAWFESMPDSRFRSHGAELRGRRRQVLLRNRSRWRVTSASGARRAGIANQAGQGRAVRVRVLPPRHPDGWREPFGGLSHVAMIHWRPAELGLASCPYGCDLGR